MGISTGAISQLAISDILAPSVTTLVLQGSSIQATSGFISTLISKTLTGASSSSFAGVFSSMSSETFTLNGVSSSSSAGLLIATLHPNINGVVITASPGIFNILISPFFIGSSAVSQIGNFDKLVNSIIGVQAISGGSSLLLSINAVLVGSAATGVAGNITTIALYIVNLMGLSVTSAIGTTHYVVSFVLGGVQAVSQYGILNPPPATGIPGDRVFFISGINQRPIGPGIVMFPTSEHVSIQILAGIGYAIASSQFYSIGQVYWDSVLRTEGIDYTRVAPFSHIVMFNPTGITSDITLVYYRWDIRVRTGFKVNSYPVPFSFTGTTIIAEKIPKQDQFFTVQYTLTRESINPMTMFARFPNIVDEVLPDHIVFDEPRGFVTFRPLGYKVFDESDNSVWGWNGSSWYLIGPFPNGTIFFVKSSGQIYKVVGSAILLIYTTGDGADLSIPEILTYPPYGESIGKNLLVDAFSANAATDYPSAFVIAERPGLCEDAPVFGQSISLIGVQSDSV